LTSARQKTLRTTTSVRVPFALSRQIQDTMAREGISPRKQSRWISDALEYIVKMGATEITERHLLAGYALNAGGNTSVTLPVTLDDDLNLALISLIAEIRQADPFSNVSKSALIRAAILQRFSKDRAGEGGV